MANPRRASAFQIAYSDSGKVQANAATIMPASSFTALLPETSKNFFSFQQTFEEVQDCSGEELHTKLLTGEIGAITITFNFLVNLFAVFLAYAFSVAAAPAGGAAADKTHLVSELPVGEYQPAFFSLMCRFKGQATPVVLRGCVVKSLKVRIDPRKIVTAEVQIRFMEAVPVADTAFPACVNALPKKSADCALTVGATNFATAKRQRAIEINWDQNILEGDHPFVDDSILPGRLERAERRTRTITYSVLGDDRDSEYVAARAGAESALSVKIGTGANYVLLESANAFLELTGGGLQKDGQAAETSIGIVATPLGRMTATVANQITTTYLTVAT